MPSLLCIYWRIYFLYICCLWVKHCDSVRSKKTKLKTKVCLCTWVYVFLRGEEREGEKVWTNARDCEVSRTLSRPVHCSVLFQTVYFFAVIQPLPWRRQLPSAVSMISGEKLLRFMNNSLAEEISNSFHLPGFTDLRVRTAGPSSPHINLDLADFKVFLRTVSITRLSIACRVKKLRYTFV